MFIQLLGAYYFHHAQRLWPNITKKGFNSVAASVYPGIKRVSFRCMPPELEAALVEKFGPAESAGHGKPQQ